MGIDVSKSPARPGFQLKPVYDSESDILAVGSDVQREWLYGIDIDGTVVFDLDAARRLANFDVLVGRRLWERGSTRAWPSQSPVGTLVFSQEAIARKSFSMPIRCVYDEERRILSVTFGKDPVDELEMSQGCLALLAGSELVGFLLRDF